MLQQVAPGCVGSHLPPHLHTHHSQPMLAMHSAMHMHVWPQLQPSVSTHDGSPSMQVLREPADAHTNDHAYD
jgi:hypothetical protein